MSGWRLLIEESFYSADGHHERLAVLEGPTYPARYYVGPYFAGNSLSPRFNSTEFYHRTEDAALLALIEMVESLGRRL